MCVSISGNMFTRQRFWEAFCRRSTICTVILCCIITTFLLFVITVEQAIDGEFKYLNLPVTKEELEQLPPLYPVSTETFPSEGVVKMEKRIHQTWMGTKVSYKVSSWIKSWLVYHPDYEYYLWTDESARQLIQERYPKFLHTYDNYYANIQRADSLRYIILYEFGGIYADLDMESLKSLEPIMRKYSCFLAQEPYEHPMLQGNFKHLAINAFMACSKGHPFMKLAVDSLELYSHMWMVVDSGGPHFLTSMLKTYNRLYELDPTDEKGVYLAPPEYFTPVVDPHKYFLFYYYCFTFRRRTKMQKEVCMNLKLYGVRKTPPAISFATHHWTRTYDPLGKPTKSMVDIHDLVPNVIIYK